MFWKEHPPLTAVLYVIRRAFRHFLWSLRFPCADIRPDMSSPEWWHEHICVPLRFGKQAFEAVCPCASMPGFAPEEDDHCDWCPYMCVIMTNKEGTALELHGSPAFIREEPMW